MKIRTLIVEDEPLAQERLQALLMADPAIELLGICGDGRTAVEKIRALKPQLVFLDVQLPELDGFGVLAELASDEMPAIIFTTAYDKFAIKAFEVRALDYLLKPFDRTRLEAALERAKKQLAGPRAAHDEALQKLITEIRPAAKGPERLSVRSAGRIVLVNVDEIDWIEAADNYVNLHVRTDEYLHRETMNSLERRLPADQFLRISRSCIVNVRRVVELQSTFHGGYKVVLQTGARLLASRRYRANLARLSGKASS